MIILQILLLIGLFLLIRSMLALKWNEYLADMALIDYDTYFPIYKQWDIIVAITNPKHYDKWTSKQWINYLFLDKR